MPTNAQSSHNRSMAVLSSSPCHLVVRPSDVRPAPERVAIEEAPPQHDRLTFWVKALKEILYLEPVGAESQ